MFLLGCWIYRCWKGNIKHICRENGVMLLATNVVTTYNNASNVDDKIKKVNFFF